MTTLRRASTVEDKAERRAGILAAAKEVFAEKGYHATTIADIARTARLSYGSVYWYFDSKEELFHALMQAEAQSLQDYVNAAMAAADKSPSGPFRAAVRATFEFFEDDRAVVKLLFRDAYSLGDRFERHLFGIFESFVSDFEVAIVEAQRLGQVAKSYPPRMVAFSMAALIGQIAHRRVVTDDGLSAGQVADFTVDLLLDGLVPRARRRR